MILCFILLAPAAQAQPTDSALTRDAAAPTVVVSDIPALRAAILAARPGDVIVMKNGTWRDVDVDLTAAGSETAPVTLRAETAGSVILTGNNRVLREAPHPTTRTEAIKEQAASYRWARQHLGIVGTEAAVDWTVPYVDISSPLGHGRAGIPVPLFNLVYHDAIMTTYNPTDLRGFLNAGVPQLGLGALSGADGEKTADAMRRMAALHERVALLELTRHEFLDADHKIERSTFADGTTVTVDWNTQTVTVNPEKR